MSFLPGGAGAGLAAVVVVVTADLMLFTGDEGAGVVTLLLFREVVLLSWSFSEGLAGSEEAVSKIQAKCRYKTVRESRTLVSWSSIIIIQVDNVKI